MGNIIAGPLPSRRVLDELRSSSTDQSGPSPVAMAFVALDAALAEHAAALLAVDRAEAALAAARASADAAHAGHTQPEITAAQDGADTARRPRSARQGGHSGGRGRGRGVGSKRRAFLIRHARERRLDRRSRDLAVRLLSAPVAGSDDIALKLAVVIAAGEAGPPEAAVFPWVWLRGLHAELVGLDGPRL